MAATALWILRSLAFNDLRLEGRRLRQAYGSLGAVIILLLWFYLTAYDILAGAELNAQIERQTARAKQDSVHRARSIRDGSDCGRAEAPPQASLIAAAWTPVCRLTTSAANENSEFAQLPGRMVCASARCS